MTITDARKVLSETTVAADICVVGAGPIGISTARRLARAGLDVVLLESGGIGHDPVANDLGEPDRITLNGGPCKLNHTRQIGGNAEAWCVRTGVTRRGVRLLPMLESDFRALPGDPVSAIPVSWADLGPYHSDASAALGIESADFSPQSFGSAEEGLIDDDPDIRTGIFRFGRGGDFVARAREELTRDPRIRVFAHATALEVLTDATGGRATGVRAATAPGREFTVEAGQVLLAAGCFAVTQLLLASDRIRPAGLGNASGALGRYFMDHPMIHGGTIVPFSRDVFRRAVMYDLRQVRGVPVMGHLQLTAAALQREDVLNLSLLMYPRSGTRRVRETPRMTRGIDAALAVREALIRRRPPAAGHILSALAGLDGVALRLLSSLVDRKVNLGRGGWSSWRNLDRRFDHFEVIQQAEQSPHPENRITLSSARDRFGARRTNLTCEWRSEDVARIRSAQGIYADALRRRGFGEFHIAEVDGRPPLWSGSSSHFMGTTRMSRSAQDGVVDPTGAVHGTHGLYVASSSVLPRGGFANVTLTALALGLRTADVMIAARKARLSVAGETGAAGRAAAIG